MSPLEPFQPGHSASGSSAPSPRRRRAQALGWPAIARGESTLLLAPTGSGKTLAAFLCVPRPADVRARRRRQARAAAAWSTSRRSRRWRSTSSATCGRRSPASRSVAAAPRRRAHRVPTVAVRTGDTPAAERARFARDPADILITTPESLYLLLTSRAREALRSGRDGDRRRDPRAGRRPSAAPTSRSRSSGSRRSPGGPLQRIGLSATQRPLDEVARFLGGAEPRVPGRARAAPRTRQRGTRPRGACRGRGRDPRRSSPTAGTRRATARSPIVDAGARKALELARRGAGRGHGAARRAARAPERPGRRRRPARTSIWTAIHPRLLELVRAHRSTLCS